MQIKANIAALYASGLTLREVGRRVGVSHSTAARYLKSAGAAARKRGRQSSGGRAESDRRYRERIKADPAKLKLLRDCSWRYQSAKKFGITPDWYQAALDAQAGCCAICKEPENGRRLAVDHDHDSGEIRALLCRACNTGIGLFREDRTRLMAAIEYLGRF